MRNKIPVTIVTGFLGAGKTTLVNHLIEKIGASTVGIIVNEFGDVGVDGELILAEEEAVIEINNGCICCTVRSDLIAGAKTILERTKSTPLSRLIVETSGLADPAPVLQSFLVDPELKEMLDIEAVVTVADGVHIFSQLTDELAREQVTFADVIVLNKIDLVGQENVERIVEQIKAINPTATIIPAARSRAPIKELIGVRKFSLPSLLEIEPSLLTDDHDHEHDQSIMSFSIIEDRPLDGAKLDRWLNQLVIQNGNDLLRMKGILNLEGEGRQFYFHSVHMILEGYPGKRWEKDQTRQSKIVFIGRNLDSKKITSEFAGCIYQEKQTSVASH
jgi:G3E family GTPase